MLITKGALQPTIQYEHVLPNVGVKHQLKHKQKFQSSGRQLELKALKNLEEQAIRLIGTDIYEKLIKGYTEKQWGRKATELPSFIIRRLPTRFTFDNNYFNHRYQGVPVDGYTAMFDKLLESELIDIQLNKDFWQRKKLTYQSFQNCLYRDD